MNPFDIARVTRKNILNLLHGLSTEQLNAVPTGYKNNLVWHLGHILVTQQLLTYNLSGNKIKIAISLVDEFRKGSIPSKVYSEEEITEMKEEFVEVIDFTELDFENGTFSQFSPYETSFGVTLNSIQDAIEFNNVHEGLHMGLIMAMRKLV